MEKSSYMHRKPWKKVTNMAVACCAFLIIGTTVATATGAINLSGGFKRLFEDDVTNELIDQGAIQELNLTAQTEDYTVTFEGLTGDSSTQFGVFKLVDHKGILGNPSILQVNVKIVGVGVVDRGELDNYSNCTNEGFTTVEGEENTFYIKVAMPSHWIYDSEEDVYISLTGLTAHYGEIEYFEKTDFVVSATKSLEIPMEFDYTFTPDRSKFPKANNYIINKTLTSEVSELTLIDMEVSKYLTTLIIKYPAKEDFFGYQEATALWYHMDKNMDNTLEYLGTATTAAERVEIMGDTLHNSWEDYSIVATNEPDGSSKVYKRLKSELIPLEGNIKLYVDGVEIARAKRQSAFASECDATVTPVIWGIPLNFEAFDADAATSIEIRYLDEVVVIK